MTKAGNGLRTQSLLRALSAYEPRQGRSLHNGQNMGNGQKSGHGLAQNEAGRAVQLACGTTGEGPVPDKGGRLRVNGAVTGQGTSYPGKEGQQGSRQRGLVIGWQRGMGHRERSDMGRRLELGIKSWANGGS